MLDQYDFRSLIKWYSPDTKEKKGSKSLILSIQTSAGPRELLFRTKSPDDAVNFARVLLQKTTALAKEIQATRKSADNSRDTYGGEYTSDRSHDDYNVQLNID